MSDTHTPRDLSRRLLLGSFGAVGAASALAACAGSSTPPGAGAPSSGAFGQGDTYTGPKVALAFWNPFTGGDGPYMKKMVEEFNKANPNVTVSMNTLQQGDYYAKVPNAVASGNGPDVAIMHIDTLATNAARRVIIPMDEIASGLKLSEDDFAPVVWKAGIYQDKRYSIPLDIHPLGFYANTAQLKKAGMEELPKDRASFEAAVKALQDKGGVKNPFWVTATW
ncbi:MAG: extracellular solute-binding protein, partial [Ornithinibacter sp.]